MKKCISFEEQKGTRYIWGNFFFFASLSSAVFCLQNCLRFLLICFACEIKGSCQSFLGNKIDFRDRINVSPNILAKKQNFKKLRHSFVDERALIITSLISFCYWKTIAPIFLQKKRPENALLTLIVTYCKILQKNKLCLPKQ